MSVRHYVEHKGERIYVDGARVQPDRRCDRCHATIEPGVDKFTTLQMPVVAAAADLADKVPAGTEVQVDLCWPCVQGLQAFLGMNGARG